MLAEWLEDQSTRELVEQYAHAAQTDLLTHGTTSDEDTIKDTAVAQPLITASTLLSAQALGLVGDDLAARTVVVSGHSVGEIPAAALAGVLSPTEAMTLVGIRGRAMAEAASAADSGMAAVLGGTEDEVLQRIAEAGLSAANINGAGQIVAAGSADGLATLAAAPPEKARVITLKVAGAFHTDFMASASAALSTAAEAISPRSPQVHLISNRDGAAVTDGSEVLSRIVDQVTRPVRWDACMTSLTDSGVTGILELLPGGTLVGLAKRGMRGVASFAVKSPADLAAAREFIAEHAG